MELFHETIEAALLDFLERHTGRRPALKPSKTAHLASSGYLREDAEAIAKTLSENASDCTLFGVPLLSSVRVENGWLLFRFTACAIDAWAETLPPAEEPDDSFFARRLWTMAHHADAPVPDDPFVLDGFYAVLFGAPNGERSLLSAPRHLDGTARVAVEQRLSRVGKVLLWERRNRK